MFCFWFVPRQPEIPKLLISEKDNSLSAFQSEDPLFGKAHSPFLIEGSANCPVPWRAGAAQGDRKVLLACMGQWQDVGDSFMERLVCSSDPGESGSFPACSNVTIPHSFPPRAHGNLWPSYTLTMTQSKCTHSERLAMQLTSAPLEPLFTLQSL